VYRFQVMILVVSTITAISYVAVAAPSCGAWMRQTDGSYWKLCVNDDGSTHCYSATSSTGANATEIRCK